MTIIIFLIVLAVLIFVHELGHFLIAKWSGIRVDAFALGFGPKLLAKKVGEVTYSLNLIPFGGYVKIHGENPDDDSISGPDKARSFANKSKWQQVAVLSAGVFFNFIFAWFLIFLAFSSGVPASISSYPNYDAQMKDRHIAITFVNKNSPAEVVGFKAGDRLMGNSLEEIQKKINESAGKPFQLEYIHNYKSKIYPKVESATIVAKQGIVEGKYAIGIAMDDVGTLQLPIHKALLESLRFTLHTIVATCVGLYDLVLGIFTGESKLASVTGPVGIAGMIGSAAKIGFTYLIMFTAIISINLGVLNLVPFPALDGGRILFVIIESIIRRPIKPVIANMVNAIGFGLLMLLIVVVTYRDIANLFVK